MRTQFIFHAKLTKFAEDTCAAIVNIMQDGTDLTSILKEDIEGIESKSSFQIFRKIIYRWIYTQFLV